MFVKSTGTNAARVYAAVLADGLQVFDLSYSNAGGQWSISTTSSAVQSYDFDRASPTTINSSDANFDYRVTHSAWPTDDEQFIFTTDELAIFNNLSGESDVVFDDRDPDLYPGSAQTLKDPYRQGNYLRIWKRSELGLSTSLKGGYYVPEGQQQGLTTLSQIGNYVSSVPNSIHQLFVRGTKAYIAHYTQGMRVLDISSPATPVEDGYYDDFQTLSDQPGVPPFFRRDLNWAQGVYGVYPDPNRPNIVYAGSFTAGLYIFSVRDFSGTIAVNTIWDGAITVSGNTTVAAGVTLTVMPGTVITFASGALLAVNGTLNANGTPSAPITFTSTSSSTTWSGILFNSGSSGSVSYCTISRVTRMMAAKPALRSITHRLPFKHSKQHD